MLGVAYLRLPTTWGGRDIMGWEGLAMVKTMHALTPPLLRMGLMDNLLTYADTVSIGLSSQSVTEEDLSYLLNSTLLYFNYKANALRTWNFLPMSTLLPMTDFPPPQLVSTLPPPTSVTLTTQTQH